MRCDECEDFELRRDHLWWWMWQRAAVAVLPKPRAHVINALGQSMSSMMNAMVGGGYARPLTHYERHRAEYERTGETIELDRMLRQVSGA